MGTPPVKTIRGYELFEPIGAGGFSVVYRAYQPAVDRQVAIKIILPEHASRPEFVQRFETEAQLIARLEHLHIVPLYDYRRESEVFYRDSSLAILLLLTFSAHFNVANDDNFNTSIFTLNLLKPTVQTRFSQTIVIADICDEPK